MLSADVHLQGVPGGADLVAVGALRPADVDVLGLDVVDEPLLVGGGVAALGTLPPTVTPHHQAHYLALYVQW